MRKWLIMIAVAALVAVGFTSHTVGVYNGLNKGVTVGSCGFELVGHFGPFCGVDDASSAQPVAPVVTTDDCRTGNDPGDPVSWPYCQ